MDATLLPKLGSLRSQMAMGRSFSGQSELQFGVLRQICAWHEEKYAEVAASASHKAEKAARAEEEMLVALDHTDFLEDQIEMFSKRAQRACEDTRRSIRHVNAELAEEQRFAVGSSVQQARAAAAMEETDWCFRDLRAQWLQAQELDRKYTAECRRLSEAVSVAGTRRDEAESELQRSAGIQEDESAKESWHWGVGHSPESSKVAHGSILLGFPEGLHSEFRPLAHLNLAVYRYPTRCHEQVARTIMQLRTVKSLCDMVEEGALLNARSTLVSKLDHCEEILLKHACSPSQRDEVLSLAKEMQDLSPLCSRLPQIKEVREQRGLDDEACGGCRRYMSDSSCPAEQDAQHEDGAFSVELEELKQRNLELQSELEEERKAMAKTRTHANQQALNRSQLVTQESTLEERVERLERECTELHCEMSENEDQIAVARAEQNPQSEAEMLQAIGVRSDGENDGRSLRPQSNSKLQQQQQLQIPALAPTMLKEALADAYERLAALSPVGSTTTPEVQAGTNCERGGHHGRLFV